MTPLLADRINKVAPGAKVISFDVFDTLVKRPVEPHLTIEATTRFVCRRLGLSPQGADFQVVLDSRQESWLPTFRKRSQAGLPAEDATLEEMFPLWLERLEASGFGVRKNKLTVRELLEFELGLEQKILEPIHDSLESLKLLKRQGAKLFFISDMYLSRKQVANLLDEAGYNGLFDGGFVSGEVGLLKRTGTLFSHIISQGLSIDLHVGDSQLADFQQPSSAGISALHWESPEMLAERRRASRLGRKLSKHTNLAPYALNDLALRVLARTSEETGLFPLIYANFGLLIVNEVSKNPAPVILPAREGLVLTQALNTVARTYPLPPRHYLPISRNAVTPVVGALSPIEFFKILQKNKDNVCLLDLLRRLEYSDAETRAVSKEFGFSDILGRFDFERDLSALQELVLDPDFLDRWKRLAEPKSERARKIIGALGLPEGKAYFVDLGWQGTIQKNLQSALGQEEHLTGLYFGLAGEKAFSRGEDRDFTPLVVPNERDFLSFAALKNPQALEIPMLAPHRSVSEIPLLSEDLSWALPLDRSSGSSYKASVQSDVVSLLPLLVSLSWLFNLESEQIAAFTRVITALQLWFPDSKTARSALNLTTDTGLGEDAQYQLISKRRGLRAGLRESLWRQGWAALHLPTWARTLVLIRDSLNWDTSLPNAARRGEADSERYGPRPLAPQGSESEDFPQEQQPLASEYREWLETRATIGASGMRAANLVRIWWVSLLSNLVRLLRSHGVLRNRSFRLNEIVGAHRKMPNLFR
jgi:FMN phosphatase YigB (HAD superfamily)